VWEVRVYDRAQEGGASHAAAGVVNPIVLRRVVPSWRAAEFLPLAEDFYRQLEQRYGVKLWYPLPLMKISAIRANGMNGNANARIPYCRAFSPPRH
jgi:hypothetical protein